MNDELENKLAQLRLKYLKSMPEKQMDVNYAWDVFRLAPNEGNYKKLRSKLHDLTGSSGLYGCNALFESCQEALSSLKQGMEIDKLGKIIDDVILAMRSHFEEVSDL